MVHLILLHGATGFWDEVVCLAVPATAIMGVALAVLRQQGARGDTADQEDGGATTDEARRDGDAPGAEGG